MADKFNFRGAERRAKGSFKAILVAAGNVAKNHFVKSFRDQGFTNQTLRKWQPRKRDDKRRRGRAILTDSGDLRRSIVVRNTNIQALRVVIGTDLPYAAIHNFGGQGRARNGRAFKMPKREFIGESSQLDKSVERVIDRQMANIFK